MTAFPRATSLPRKDVDNGWYSSLPAPPPALRVSGSLAFDWVIVGAGICGLSVARRLAELKPDDSIAVVEAMRVGYGTSGRNAGFMLSHHSHGGISDIGVGRRNDRLFTAGYQMLRQVVAHNQIQCGWNEWGQIYVSVGREGEKKLNAVAESFNTLGVELTRIGGKELKRITGTGFYRGGVRVGDSALVQPAAMMRGLAQTLPANVTLFEDSPVNGFDANGGYTVLCGDGEINAKQLVLTNNLFAEQFGLAGRRVVPMATYASLTRPLTEQELTCLGEDKEFGLLPASQNGSTVRRTADGRILMRNTLAYARENVITDHWLSTAEQHHRDSIGRRWPALADVELAATWGGVLGFTRNEGVVFGQYADGLFMTLTTDAAPMTRGTIMGKLLADKICGVDSEELRLLESVPAAAKLPPEFILRFVAQRRIRKFERLDAQER